MDLRLDDEILEDFVEGCAQVNVAVGVGRPVVQNILRPPGARLANPLDKASSSSHCASILGSAAGRLAFIGEIGFGRLTVFFRSTEMALMDLLHRSLEPPSGGFQECRGK